MNKVILLGRLAKNPEIKVSKSNENMLVAKFSLAVNRKYVKQGEERQADFINIVAYSKLAEFIQKYIQKGNQICISGRIQNRNYEDSNGTKHYVTEIIAEEIFFADAFKKKDDEKILSSSTPVNDKNIDNNTDDEFVSDVDDLPF